MADQEKGTLTNVAPFCLEFRQRETSFQLVSEQNRVSSNEPNP